MTLAGRSNWGFVTTHVLETVAFLRGLPFVDAKRVGVAGMSLGCIPALYSAVLDEDIAAVVYNDFASSWAANATSVTKRLHPDVNLPWLAEVFFGKADFSPAFRKEIADSVSAKPAW